MRVEILSGNLNQTMSAMSELELALNIKIQ